MTALDVLPFLHGCTGIYEIDGLRGFSRFTAEELEYYSLRSDADFVRSHAPAGMYLEFMTDAPEISFTYRLYRARGFYVMTSGFDIWENGIFSANYAVDPECSDEVTVTYRRKSAEASVVRIYFPSGCVVLPVSFSLGHAAMPDSGSRKSKRILFCGDSITQSAYIPTPSLSWYAFAADALNAEYVNRGIGSMIFDPESLPTHDDYAPDYVFIEYGSNDLGKVPDNETALSSAKAWLVKMCGLYPEAQKICILPDFTPCGREEAQIRQDSYCAELNRICADFGIPAFSSAPLIPNLDVMFCADHVHFSEAGSAVFANRLLEAMKEI